MDKIVKRDGRVVSFDRDKIAMAVLQSAIAVGGRDRAAAERITDEVLALLEAEHTCMTIRGVRKQGSRMVTLASAGCFESDPAMRAEVISLLSGSSTSTPG